MNAKLEVEEHENTREVMYSPFYHLNLSRKLDEVIRMGLNNSRMRELLLRCDSSAEPLASESWPIFKGNVLLTRFECKVEVFDANPTYIRGLRWHTISKEPILGIVDLSHKSQSIHQT